MSKATAAAPPSTANEVPIDRPPRRQSPPTFDCRAATIKPQTTPLRDNHAPSIMPPPRRRIPILIVAAFSSRSPRDIKQLDIVMYGDHAALVSCKHVPQFGPEGRSRILPIPAELGKDRLAALAVTSEDASARRVPRGG